MSTSRFMITTANVPMSTTPSTAGRSCRNTESMAMKPRPVDVEHALGDHRAADEQRHVEAEHRHDRRQARAQAVPEITLRSDSPLARAVRMKSSPIVSSMLPRTMRA